MQHWSNCYIENIFYKWTKQLIQIINLISCTIGQTLGKSNTSINVEEKMMISVILLVHWHVFTPAFFVVVILYTCSFHQNSALCLNFVMCITYIATKWVHVIFLCVVHIQIRRTLVRRKSQFIIHVFIYTAV